MCNTKKNFFGAEKVTLYGLWLVTKKLIKMEILSNKLKLITLIDVTLCHKFLNSYYYKNILNAYLQP